MKLKEIILLVTVGVVLITGRGLCDTWLERPDLDFYAHPLNEITVSSRAFARGEIVKVLRKSMPRHSGMLKVIVASGKHRGKFVYAKNLPLSASAVTDEREGVNVIVSYFDGDEPKDVLIDGYDRTGMVVVLILVFSGLVVLVGGKRSLYSFFALIAAVLIVKFFYIPQILAGYSPVLCTLITVTGIVILTIIAIAGFSRKSAAAITGTLAGLIAIFCMGFVIYKAAHISGFYLKEIQLLNYFSSILSEKPLCFYRNFLVSILVLGASGVVMDVGVTVAYSMHEITTHSPGINRRSLYLKGMAVGKDVVSTMVNTLIIAYMGISLGNILVKSLHITSFFQAVNMEFIHVVFYQAILGSSGCLICVLVTAFIGSTILGKKLTKAEK